MGKSGNLYGQKTITHVHYHRHYNETNKCTPMTVFRLLLRPFSPHNGKYITQNLLLCQTLLSAEVKTPLVGLCTFNGKWKGGEGGTGACAYKQLSHSSN